MNKVDTWGISEVLHTLVYNTDINQEKWYITTYLFFLSTQNNHNQGCQVCTTGAADRQSLCWDQWQLAGEMMLWLFDGICRFTFESDSSFTQANGVRMWEQKWTRKWEWLHFLILYLARQLLQYIQFTSWHLLHAHPSHYWLCTFNAVVLWCPSHHHQ